MNEQQNKNTVKNAINSLKDEAGIWHYIKTFLTFFALVGTAGVTLLTMFPASHYVAIFYIMSIVGFVSAIILSHEYIIAMCSALSNVFSKIFAVLGVVLVWVPYIGLILSFLSVIFGYAFGIILSIGICFAFPIGLTLFAYFIDRSKEIVNKKKEMLDEQLKGMYEVVTISNGSRDSKDSLTVAIVALIISLLSIDDFLLLRSIAETIFGLFVK